MTAWKGLGRYPHVQARSDRILACLLDSETPRTTDEIAKATGLHYGHVYQDLRRLSGPGFRYTGVETQHNTDGWPVIWHMWESTGGRTLWSLVPAYRAEQTQAVAALESLLGGD